MDNANAGDLARDELFLMGFYARCDSFQSGVPNAIPKAMKPPPVVTAMDVPSAEDVHPGGTERLVRLVLGDDMANHLNRKYPGRISVYCDAVRFMISTLHAMGAVDGEDRLPVQFPEDLMGLRPLENRLLLEGLVASGRFVRAEPDGYRLSRRMFLAIDAD